MITEYTPVSWSANEPITIDKLNAMANNTQLLYEKTPKTLYKAHGIVKDKGVRIFSTVVAIPATKSPNYWLQVFFGSYFSVGCKPIITLGVDCYGQLRYHHNFSGIGVVIPDHRGCEIRIQADELNTKNNKISKTLYVHITAVGW